MSSSACKSRRARPNGLMELCFGHREDLLSIFCSRCVLPRLHTCAALELWHTPRGMLSAIRHALRLVLVAPTLAVGGPEEGRKDTFAVSPKREPEIAASSLPLPADRRERVSALRPKSLRSRERFASAASIAGHGLPANNLSFCRQPVLARACRRSRWIAKQASRAVS